MGQSMVRVDVATTDVERRSEHVKRLASDLQLMSTEIDGLVGTNEQLEVKLKKTWKQNEVIENLLAEERKKSEALERASISLDSHVSSLTEQRDALLDDQRKLRTTSDLENSRWQSQTQAAEARFSKASLALHETRLKLEDMGKSQSLAKTSLDATKMDMADKLSLIHI